MRLVMFSMAFISRLKMENYGWWLQTDIDWLSSRQNWKGNPTTPSKAELKKLKGPDPTLPGYTAEFEQVHVGQYVQVYLPKPKAAKSTAKRDDGDVEPTGPKAVMIYIVGEDKSR